MKAGQAVDRVGIMLGLKFPCGAELEKLAMKSSRKYKIKPVIKDGSCCLSGVENQCRKMLDSGEDKSDIAKYCLDYISESIMAMTQSAVEKYGNLPLIYAGGVMSDIMIRGKIISEYKNAKFAEPAFSCDNAAGIALFGYLSMR